MLRLCTYTAQQPASERENRMKTGDYSRVQTVEARGNFIKKNRKDAEARVREQ